jgi:hypothetical protein
MTIIIAFIAGIAVGAFFGGKFAWKHAFRELGRAELHNRMQTARSRRPWRSN